MKKRGEFGEEINTLGELPEEIEAERARVRHTRSKSKRSSSRRDAIGDIKYQGKSNYKSKKTGTIPYNSKVTSTFDSRPVNAQDFLFSTVGRFLLPATDPALPSTVKLSYPVPGGFIAVLRGYRYELLPIVPIPHTSLILNISVNNVAQLGYKNLRHGKYLGDFAPSFLLSDTGHNIDFVFNASKGLNAIEPDPDNPIEIREIVLEVYGNLIQISGAPLALEIANKQTADPIIK